MISNRDAEFPEHSVTLRSLNQTYGAVAYLNMLPFFCHDQNIRLFETPAELNQHLGSGQLIAGCSSVIAGLRAGLDVVPGFFGVAADVKVESVFFEPLVQSSTAKELWRTILVNNQLVINTFEERLQGLSGGSAESSSRPRSVKIFSSGASAQSIWLLQTLLLLQGFPSEVVLISDALSRLSLIHLHEHLNVGEDLACLLTIGDPALERRVQFAADPENQNARIDLAQFWNDFCGLPCIFAMWFLGGNVEKGLAVLASAEIASKAKSWERLDANEKLKLASEFLERSNKSELAVLMGNESLIEYLNNLKYRLNEAPYIKSFQLMRTLFQAQLRAMDGSSPPARSYDFSGKEVGVFKPLDR